MLKILEKIHAGPETGSRSGIQGTVIVMLKILEKIHAGPETGSRSGSGSEMI
jgi:hypothetical protein